MARMHLFELEDQAWFPSLLRDAGTAYLALAARVGGHAKSLAPLVARALERSRETRIVDLCSGGAGPMAAIVAELAREGVDARATLSDFFPNQGSLARACAESDGRLDWSRAPVDALRVPRELRGLRTLVNAFHHFRPAQARAILADATEARQPICVLEVVAREPLAFVGMLLSPLLVALAVPFLRPFRWAWLPLTYLVPVLPLFVLWDGLVSCLRVYSPQELEALVASLEPRHREAYDWEIGRAPLPPGPVRATYLLGVARAA